MIASFKLIKLVDNVICKVRFGRNISLEECSCISARQLYCFENAFSYIDKRMYTNALHEFMDCVDDYGKARTTNSLISLNEAITYYSILLKFKGVLESES